MALDVLLGGVSGRHVTVDLSGITAVAAVVDWGDGSPTQTVAPDGSGAASASHSYTDPGAHAYTISVQQPIVPLAADLEELEALAADLDALSDTAGSLAEWSAVVEDAELVVDVVVPRLELATVQADGQPPVVELTAWIAEANDVTAWRLWRSAPGDYTLIGLGDDVDTALIREDREAPFGVEVTYILTAEWDGGVTSSVQAVVVLYGADSCWLTDVVSGTVRRIELQAWPTRSREARQSVLQVAGRPDPVVISDQHLLPSGSWTILTRTDEQTAGLVQVLTGSRIVRLRTPPGSSVASCWASVGAISEERFSGRGGDQRRLVGVEVQEIAPLPATLKDISTSLEVLADQAETLANLAGIGSTLADLALIRGAAA